MPFDALQEAKTQIGETEFYGFDFGTFVERYTTNRRRTFAFGEWWDPLPITRRGRSSKGDVVADDSRLLMPCRPSFVAVVAETGLETLGCTIIRGFGQDYANDYKVPWWVGYLTEITVTTTSVQGRLRGAESLFQELIPKVMVQSGCNNRLGDQTCGVDVTPSEEFRNVVSISEGGRLVTLDGAIPANDWFTLGQMRIQGTTQAIEILQQQGDQFVLFLPITGLTVGTAVVVTPGCMKRYVEDCGAKWGNTPNNVSMPNVPNTQPVTDGF